MRQTLAGTRIRTIRTQRKMGQADLAQAAGVSPSYLNLIEHNRRRASPRVLRALARALDIDPDALQEEADESAAASLREIALLSARGAAAKGREPDPELDRVEELLGRFPGWAALLTQLGARIEAQERTIKRLSDRMAHDPNMSAALYEIISAVTSVQSTSSILVETPDIDPDWRTRFLSNLHGDALRLASAAEALVAFLDAAAEDTGAAAPLEELETWLDRHDFHFAAIEDEKPLDAEAMTAGQAELASDAARQLARGWLRRAQSDARALPIDVLAPRLIAMFGGTDPGGFAPETLARDFRCDLGTVLRRLAVLPPLSGVPRFGLVVHDGSGSPVFRRPVEGFALPRFGGGCPLWPVFQALFQPGRGLRRVIEMAGRPPMRFVTHAVAQERGTPGFDTVPVWESVMLITPASVAPGAGDGPVLPVGSSCRVCPRDACPARREPSLIMG